MFGVSYMSNEYFSVFSQMGTFLFSKHHTLMGGIQKPSTKD